MDPAVCGLQNVGNTCFANSAMQCLIHSPPFRDSLTGYDAALRSLKRACTLRKFLALGVQYFDERNAEGAINPYSFLRHVLKKSRHLRLGRQEDGHEFLRHLVDCVHESEQLGKEELSLAQQVWGFYLESCVRCRKCGHCSITRDAAMDLSLDISGRGAMTLDGALEAFFAEEQLDRDNKVDCERCQKKRLSAKRFALGSLPQVLVCHLKRFDAFGRKVGRTVKYPEVVDVGRHLTDAQLARMQKRSRGGASVRAPTGRYRLFGVVVHNGSSQFGHYYAYVCPNVDTGRWWLLNDAQCSRAHRGEALSQQAYVLFFLQEQASPAHTTPRVHARLQSDDDDGDDEDDDEDDDSDGGADAAEDKRDDRAKGGVRAYKSKRGGGGGGGEKTQAGAKGGSSDASCSGGGSGGGGGGGAPRGLFSTLSDAFHSLVGGEGGQAASSRGPDRVAPSSRAARSSAARVAASERGAKGGEEGSKPRLRSAPVSERAWSSVGGRAEAAATTAVGSRPPRRDLRGRELRAPVDAFDRGIISPPGVGSGPGLHTPGHDAEALELEYEAGYDDTSAGPGSRRGGSGRGRRAGRRIGVTTEEEEEEEDLEAGRGGGGTAQGSKARIRVSVSKAGTRKRLPRCGPLSSSTRRRLQGLTLLLFVAAAVVASLVGMGAITAPL